MLRQLLLITGLWTLISSCQKEISLAPVQEIDTEIKIRFNAVVSDQNLEFEREYINIYQEPFTVSAIKFYIQAVELENTSTGRKIRIFDNYRLVDFSNPGTALIGGSAPNGSYNTLNFVIGVDSALNVSGAQAGDLDPAKGMFWTWNSGYIMAKLEGNSALASTPNHSFEYHIGGFAGPDNVVKKISLPLAQGQMIRLDQYPNPVIELNADINEWFGGDNNISIGSNPTCMTPGLLARQIAGNYYRMFSVTGIVSSP